MSIPKDPREPTIYSYTPSYNPDGTEKHVICDGARYHVVWWDSDGEHCSNKNCEINKRTTGGQE